MKYRKLGKLDWEPSALGFGCMRLPTASGAAVDPNILQEDTNEMFRYAIENGVNYFDTAYGYHSGKSEEAVGKALKPYRDKIKIATKSPMMFIKTKEEYDRVLDEQLKRLGVEMIDFYLFHNLNADAWKTIKNEDLLGRAEAAQKAGKIGHIAFSFHDSYDVFEDIINGYDKWLFCQIQYNFTDANFQAGRKGLELAASKGIGVVAMEPLKGGKLAEPIPEVKELMKERGTAFSLAELALKWIWRQPEISLVLSGMTNMSQLTDNVRIASGSYELSQEDSALLDEIDAIYKRRGGVPCTKCAYCMPCPHGVHIPMTLEFYNEAVIFDYDVESKRMYSVFKEPAKACVGCKECEAKCPQSIPISEWMPKIDDLLGT